MEEIGGIEKREQKRIDNEKDKDGTETTTMDDNHTDEHHRVFSLSLEFELEL
jgi:hypothetical protein